MHDGTGPQRPNDPVDGWVEVDIPFPGVRQFEEEFAPNLATDGLFIPTPDPLPPSTVVRFHVTLPDDFVLLEGTGIVVWARERDDPSGAPSGMSLRFATLSPHYQDLLDRIVQTHVERGGTPFEVEPRVGDAPAVRGAESPPSPAAWGVASERPRLTVRRAGAPDAVISGENSDSRGPAHVPGLTGPLDRTVSLPPRAAAASHVHERSSDVVETVPEQTGGSGPVVTPEVETEEAVDAGWPPWDADASPSGRGEVMDRHRVPPAGPTDVASGKADRPGPGALDIEGVSDLAETSRDDAPSEFPGALFSNDTGKDASLPGLADPGDSASASQPEASFIEAVPPRRRWSMGRTVATLAAAIVVVGVVAVLVLSPWSRLVDSEADVGEPDGVAAAAEAADPAADQPVEPVQTEDVPTSDEPARSSTDLDMPEATPLDTETATEAQAPSPVSERPASRIESISWQDVAGATRVTLRGDGLIRPDRVALIPMESPPRVLIRIRHIETRYESYVLEVGTPVVSAIRTGLHPELTPPALYVVCDLSGNDVHILDSTFDGASLTITLGS